MSLPRREVRDIISWIDCWIAYCQVVLTSSPSRSIELLKYLDLIVRTHRSGGSDILEESRTFPGPSRLGLHWPGSFPPILHKQQRAWASHHLCPFVAQWSSAARRSPGLPPQPQKSAAPGTAVIALAVSYSANAATSVPSVKDLTAPSRASGTPATTAPARPSRAYRLTNRRRSPLLSFLRSRYLWLVAVCRQVLRFFLVSDLFQLFCARPCFPWS